jgi:hypothetical protein
MEAEEATGWRETVELRYTAAHLVYALYDRLLQKPVFSA